MLFSRAASADGALEIGNTFHRQASGNFEITRFFDTFSKRLARQPVSAVGRFYFPLLYLLSTIKCYNIR